MGRYQVHRTGRGRARPRGADEGRARPRRSTRWSSSPNSCLRKQARPAASSNQAHSDARHRPQAAAVLASLGPYREMLEPQRQHLLSLYRPVDVAFKVVGTGSVGLRDYCIYFEGNGPNDPLFLQIKEEPASAYAPYLPDAQPPHHNGQRVAEGQKAMQVQSDPFLGWTHISRARLPGPPAQRPQGFHRPGGPGRRRPGGIRRGLRRAAGPRPRPLRRPADSVRLHRLRRRLCRGTGKIRLGLRRPDGKGLGGVEAVGQDWGEVVEPTRISSTGTRQF